MWSFILLLLLLGFAVALVPVWPYSREWSYGPFNFAVGALTVFLLLVWFGIIVIIWPGAAP